jgi:glycosyltransferase involved in cell wall biosynthesis
MVEDKITNRISRIQERVGDGVLVIVPAYNEEESIEFVIESITKIAPFCDILVINDGSSDNTASRAKRAGAEVLNLPFNLGIGGAVRAGYAFAYDMGYQWVLRFDGDGQHDVDIFYDLLEPVVLGKADAVFGSRFCQEGENYRPSFIRRMGIWVYAFLVSIIIHQRIHDATSGLWCVNRRTASYFKKHFAQDYPEVESHIMLYKAGLSQMEIPARMHKRIGGHSSIGMIRSIYYAFKVLLVILVRVFQDVPRLPEEDFSAVRSTGRSNRL